MTPSVPDLSPGPAARTLFGDALPVAERYVRLLADAGVTRGLIGPREVPRLWDRHVLNSAVLESLVPRGVRVADVGSGAGLPGIPLAIARPDLHVTLIEPMLRRTTFLDEVIGDLGLTERVRVVRGRADDRDVVRVAGQVDRVVARAVAPLDRLVRWTLPLVHRDGELLAMKGESAAVELAALPEISGEVVQVGTGEAQTWVIRVWKGRR